MEELKRVYNYVTNIMLAGIAGLAFLIMYCAGHGMITTAAVISVAFIIVTVLTVKVFASFEELYEEEES